MKLARIHLFPDSVLRKPAERVSRFDDHLQKVLKSMAITMEKQPAGIGIAAPQIGVLMRLAIVDVSARVRGAKRLYLINPVILEMRQPVLNREGCMSLPEYSAYLKRYEWVRLSWQNPEGQICEQVATGIEAICVQHEVDHLEGILFIDRVASLKTDMIPRKTHKAKGGSSVL